MTDMGQPPQDPSQQPGWSGQPQPGWGAPPPPAQYGQGYGQGYGTPGYYQAPQTETKAIVALVLAIASFVVCPVIPAIVALVLAGQAKAAIASSGGRLTGEGMVTAAKVVSWVHLALSVLVLGFILLAVATASTSDPYGLWRV